MHRALQLSEMVRSILEHLDDDRRSLHSALLVCTAWTPDALDVLWRHPKLSALAALPPSRRQKAADKARRVEARGPLSDGARAALAPLHFPRLRSLGTDVNCGEIAAFAGRCPALRLLVVTPLYSAAADEGVLALLRTNGAGLAEVFCAKYLEPETLVALACLPRLRRFHLLAPVVPSAARAVAEDVAAPFPRLEELQMSGPPEAVARLLPPLDGRLVRLKLQVRDEAEGGDAAAALRAVSRLRNLVALQLSMRGFGNAPPSTEFLVLAQLSKLETVELRAQRRLRASLTIPISDDDFTLLV
jgi:hypothetical protein